MQTTGPLINNAVYQWSIDHAFPALIFLWTAFMSFISVLFVNSVGFFS